MGPSSGPQHLDGNFVGNRNYRLFSLCGLNVFGFKNHLERYSENREAVFEHFKYCLFFVSGGTPPLRNFLFLQFRILLVLPLYECVFGAGGP